jgi:hypothetical protein
MNEKMKVKAEHTKKFIFKAWCHLYVHVLIQEPASEWSLTEASLYQYIIHIYLQTWNMKNDLIVHMTVSFAE